MAFFLSPWLYIVEGYVGRWYNGSIKSGLIGEKTNEKYIDYFKLAKKMIFLVANHFMVQSIWVHLFYGKGKWI